MSTVDTVSWIEEARRVASNIRLRVFGHVMANDGGYLSQACSSAEIFATLFTRVMKLGPSQGQMVPVPFTGVPGPGRTYQTGAVYNGPKAPDLDRFIFSPSHYALVLYSTLIEVGRMAPEGLEQFNQDGSTVEMIAAEHSPGAETTTGSLGQGISQAGGIALARKLRGDTGRVWVFMTDGEFQEGQVWEAFSTMSYYKLDNIGIYVDVNGQQCDGAMKDVMTIEPLDQRLEAFGARVFRVNGHDPEALAAPAALEPDGRPLVVLAMTNPVCGIELMSERAPKLHYLRFKSDEERQAYQRLYDGMRRTVQN